MDYFEFSLDKWKNNAVMPNSTHGNKKAGLWLVSINHCHGEDIQTKAHFTPLIPEP